MKTERGALKLETRGEVSTLMTIIGKYRDEHGDEPESKTAKEALRLLDLMHMT